MRNFKKAMAFVIISFMIMSVCSVCASASTKMSVTFRVEGFDSNIYYETLSVPYTESLTAGKALDYLDTNSDNLSFKGVSEGYISEVNGISSGKFGGWDGWYFAVNDTSPDVGINDYVLSDNDSLVLYYGGYPCAIPLVDTSRLDSDGIIKFTSVDTEYDSDWNPTKVFNSIKDAIVTVNGSNYITDNNGEIKISSDNLEAVMSVQIDKKDSAGAPAVLRFAPDFCVNYNGVQNTDSDTDTGIDTDTSTDTETDTDKDKVSSSTSSSSKATVVSTSTAARTTGNSTASVAAAPTGDGRIYFAVGVFAVALVVVVLMLILKRKPKD